jgi:hypothetical protein
VKVQDKEIKHQAKESKQQEKELKNKNGQHDEETGLLESPTIQSSGVRLGNRPNPSKTDNSWFYPRVQPFCNGGDSRIEGDETKPKSHLTCTKLHTTIAHKQPR